MAAELTPTLTAAPEAPRAGDRLLDSLIRIGESRLTKTVAWLQLPIYAAFVNSAMREGMSWWGAALHPVLNLSGGLDALLGNAETTNQLVFAASLGELKSVGFATLITVGAATADRIGKISRGELPIVDPDGVLFLSAGFNLPLGEAIGKAVVGKATIPGGAKNLYFAALYGNEQAKPVKPKAAFQRRHFIAPADLQLNITDTDVLEPTGALKAKTVILAAPDDRTLEIIATTIKQQQGDRVRIIPLPQTMTSFEPYSTIDQETGERMVLTEAPINPFRSVAELVAKISDSGQHEQLVVALSSGRPQGKKESRQAKLLESLSRLSGKKIRIYLNGSDGGEKQALAAAFKLAGVKDNVQLVKAAKNANVVLSFGRGEITDDVSVHEAAEEITQRIKDDLSKPETVTDRLKGLLHSVVSRVSGNRIRQRLI